MAGNTSTKKQFKGAADTTREDSTLPPKSAARDQNMAGKQKGQIGESAGFANPMNRVNAQIGGMSGTYNDIGEVSGFITDGYLDKQDTPFGEAAKFNYLPPGMDISNQANAEIHTMPLVCLTAESYPGDGWMPTPRDVAE
jgi:hypothetical protein